MAARGASKPPLDVASKLLMLLSIMPTSAPGWRCHPSYQRAAGVHRQAANCSVSPTNRRASSATDRKRRVTEPAKRRRQYNQTLRQKSRSISEIARRGGGQRRVSLTATLVPFVCTQCLAVFVRTNEHSLVYLIRPKADESIRADVAFVRSDVPLIAMALALARGRCFI